VEDIRVGAIKAIHRLIRAFLLPQSSLVAEKMAHRQQFALLSIATFCTFLREFSRPTSHRFRRRRI
jgi:hypothetical protein